MSRRRNPQTDTPAFRRWFGDSKVVDPKGNPLVVYHGSPKRFDTFVRPDIAAILKDGYADEDEQNQGMGIYFTDSAENAATYGREVYPVYLRMLNPLIVDAQGENWSYVPFKGSFYYADDIVSVAEGKGHDGVVFLNIYDSKSANGILSNTYIVFDPKQIKSATGNRGTFDPDDPSILRNPRETVADRIKRFERYEVRTEESKNYPLFGKGFLALRLRFTTPQQQRALDDVETLWLQQWDEDHRATARANPRRRNPRNPQTDTPTGSAAFRRWFGNSKVVDARGEPLIVYHGTAAEDFSAFSAGPRSHLGFHFGTQASAEDKLRGDVRRWEPGTPRRGDAPAYLTSEDMRDRAREVNRVALATIRAERSRIESSIRERSVPIDLGALLDAHGGDVEAALAEFHLLRTKGDAKPTPEEQRRLSDLAAAERRADDALANVFAFRRPGERVLPVYLSIENPLSMRDTNWGEPAMIKKDHPELRLRGRTLTEIRNEIEGRGHDGIVYKNAVEDVGSLSWIAFRPEQIKSATGNRGTFDPADPDIRHNPRRAYTSAMRTDPELWEEVKAEVTRGSKGGKPGQWSARKAQLAVALYKARGGDYYGPKSPYNALAKWTREDWRTKSGRPSLETGERYLPAAAIAALTPAEYAATTRAKRAGMKKGQQFVPQPETVAKKVRRHRRNPAQGYVFYHGAQRWEGPPQIVAHRKGHAEHGPGIYLTTAWQTATKYAKGGGAVYRIELSPETRWLEGARLPLAETVAWVRGLPRLRGKSDIVDTLSRTAERTGRDTLPAFVLVNAFVNRDVASGQHGPSLAAYLVAHGIDASLVQQGAEDWVVVFNPGIVRSVWRVSAADVSAEGFAFDLPKVRA